MEKSIVLKANDLVKSYGKKENTFIALKGVTLAIKEGESVAIIGKSGSGKSTLMHILAALDRPDSGDLELIDSETGQKLEMHLSTSSMAEYRRRVAEWQTETETWCRAQSANYLLVRSDWDVERIMLDILRRRGITA